jgi:hypothetical protein
MYLLWFQSIDPGAEYRPNVAEVHRQQRETVARWLHEDRTRRAIAGQMDARQVADYFCAAAAGIVFHWLVNPQFPVAQATAEMRAELALRLSPRSTAATPGSRAPVRKDSPLRPDK